MIKKVLFFSIIGLIVFLSCPSMNPEKADEKQSDISNEQAAEAFTYMMDEFFYIKVKGIDTTSSAGQYSLAMTSSEVEVAFKDYQIRNAKNGYTTLSGKISGKLSNPDLYTFDITFVTGAVKTITGTDVPYSNHDNMDMDFYANGHAHSIKGYDNPFQNE